MDYETRRKVKIDAARASGFFDRAVKFQEELSALEEKYQVSHEHEDSHGSFLFADMLNPGGFDYSVMLYPDELEE